MVQTIPTMVGYRPPKGFRIVSVRKLNDGTYEVTLEPWGLPSWNLRSGVGANRPHSCDNCNGYLCDVVNDKNGSNDYDPCEVAGCIG